MEERLNHEILFDILSSRLPVTSLLRLRSASTSLRNTIDDSCFVTRHLTRAHPKEPGQILLFQDDHRNGSTFLSVLLRDGDGVKTSRLAELTFCSSYIGMLDIYNSCNGLFCFHYGWSVILFNPITIRQEEAIMLSILPDFDRKRCCFYDLVFYGLGHDPSTNTYKVIRSYFMNKTPSDFTMNLGMENYFLEIYTLGTSSWRTINAKPPCPTRGRPIFAYGALHWMPDLDQNNTKKNEGKLVSFDMAKEVFYLTPHPVFQNFQLVDLGGCLGMVDLSSSTRIEIWLLKDCCGNGNEKKKKREWVKEYKIDLQEPDFTDNEYISNNISNKKRKVVGMWENGEILLQSYRRLFSYNPKTDKLRYIFELDRQSQVHLNRGSLVSLASLNVKNDMYLHFLKK